MFKKICALCITLVILLSLGTVMASAALPEDVQFWPGEYGVSEEDFSAFGDIEIQWDSEASSRLNLTDGKMDDWNGYDMVTLDAANMVSWVGDPSTAPLDWSIKTYFVADSEWLYIGFFVFDNEFAYGKDAEKYDGDAFQVCIDFGGLLGDTLKNNPDSLVTYKNIFYSFSCIQDGAPLQIMRQESDDDMLLSEANGNGVKGSARKTTEGWSAEFALSWQQLYDDYVWKAWIDDPTIYVGGADNLPLKIGCCLYYLDRDETAGEIKWAAGTTNGITNDAGEPCLSFTAYDNGINLYLTYEDDMTFKCPGIVPISLEETIPPTEVTTEAPTEAPTEETTEEPTEAPEENKEQPTEAPKGNKPADTKDDGGCGSVVGFGAIAIIALATGFGVASFKKKD